MTSADAMIIVSKIIVTKIIVTKIIVTKIIVTKIIVGVGDSVWVDIRQIINLISG
jgi:hypothetical protein